MKKSVGVLFVFLFLIGSIFFITLVKAETECKYADPLQIRPLPTSEVQVGVPFPDCALGINFIWDAVQVCSYEIPTQIQFPELGLVSCINDGYNYTVGNFGGSTVTYGFCYTGALSVPSYEICRTPIAPTCPDNQTLFKMYKENNSHVSLWDDDSLNISVCYSEIFGYEYTQSNPHECTDKNVLFYISNSEGSHVSLTETAEYDTPVCYGGLACIVVTKPSVCDVGFGEVLDLYQENNTHVSLPGDSNYNLTLCCHNGAFVEESYWKNLKNEQIEEAQPSDTVLMTVGGSGLGELSINYSVKQESYILFWKIIKELKFVSSSLELTPLFLNSGDKTVYFTAISSEKNWTSSDLKIPLGENNALPYAEIILPKEGEDLLVNQTINLSALVYDEDDFLDVYWEFGDGKSQSFSNYSLAINGLESLDVSHNYSDCGAFTTKLTAREIERNQVSEIYSNIFVFKEGICVFPVISSPENGKFDYGRIVHFDAGKSFVTNCSSGFIEDVDFTIGNLNCSYIHAPGQEVVGENYNLSVEWNIDNKPSIQGSWGQESASGKIQNFLRYFSEPNYHVTKLNLIYEN